MRCSKRWPWKLAAAVGLIVVVLAGLPGCGPGTQRAAPSMTMEEACRPVRPKEDRAVARVRRALRQPIDVAFDKTPLTEALETISQKSGLTILADSGLLAEGIDLSRRSVTLAVNQVPVGEILDIILSADLATVLRPDCVFITTRGVGMQNFSLVIYPIADLLLSNDPKNNYDWQDLLDVLKRNVNYMADHSVASWTDEGGPAVVDFLGGALVVTQTPRGQERVMEFLAMLRKARAQDGSYAPVFMPGAAGAKHIRRRLAERVDVDFENTTLSAALGFLQEALKGVNLVVDPDLAAQGIDLTLRAITLKWKQTPINEVLTKVLGPDLGYRVYPQYVLVSTRDRLQQNLPTVMYPIRDLLVERRLPREGSELGEADRQRQTIGGSADSGDSGQFFVRDAPREIDLDVWWQELVDIIKRNFNNFDDRNVAAWTDEGGPAAIDYYYGGVLIVTQTPRAHERIAELLSLLREAMTCVERQLQ